MCKFLVITVLFILLFTFTKTSITAGAEETHSTGKAIRPLWRVTTYIPGPSSTMSKVDFASFIGKLLDIGESYITFDDSTCRGMTLSQREDTLSNYLLDSETATAFRDTIGYDNEAITIILTNCSIEGFDKFVRLSDRRFIVQLRGVFFIFSPNIYR